MSAAPAMKIDWIRRNLEKVLLVAVLLVLLVSAAILAVRIEEAHRRIVESGWSEEVEGRKVNPVDLGGLQAAHRLVLDPARVTPPELALFSSELRVSCWSCSKPIEYHAMECPFCGADQPDARAIEEQDSDGDGIPDEWEIAHGLDPFNPDDAHIDFDGDGFTALEEYQWGTDPRDPESHPPLWVRLRFDRVVTEPFRFLFQSRQEIREGEFVYQLNDRERNQTHFLPVGATVDGFEIEEYVGAEDALVIRRGDRRIRLSRGREVQDDQITVRFAFLIDRTWPEARPGQAFEIRGEEYRVLEVQPESVMILDPEGERRQIKLLTAEERRLMEGPAGMDVFMPGEMPPGF